MCCRPYSAILSYEQLNSSLGKRSSKETNERYLVFSYPFQPSADFRYFRKLRAPDQRLCYTGQYIQKVVSLLFSLGYGHICGHSGEFTNLWSGKKRTWLITHHVQIIYCQTLILEKNNNIFLNKFVWKLQWAITTRTRPDLVLNVSSLNNFVLKCVLEVTAAQ